MREEKFRKIINNLRAIKPKKLFIIGDGPKSKSQENIIENVRKVVKEIDWEVTLKTNFSKINLGGPKRIPSGLDWVFKHVEECIIIEDDLQIDQSFFYFASYILNKYKNNSKISSVVANNNYEQKDLKADYFFSIQAHVWGWATWKNIWQNRIKKIDEIKDEEFTSLVYKNLKNKKLAKQQIKLFKHQKYKRNIPNWDMLWQFNCYTKGLLSIYYKFNLIEYDGRDEEATHKDQFFSFIEKMPSKKKVSFPIKDPIKITENYEFLDFQYHRKSNFLRIYKRIHIKIYLFILFIKKIIIKDNNRY